MYNIVCKMSAICLVLNVLFGIPHADNITAIAGDLQCYRKLHVVTVMELDAGHVWPYQHDAKVNTF